MTNEEILSAILTADLTKEQRDALLGEYANKLIRENKDKEKTWEERHEETIEKSRKQSEEVKERLKEYEERSRKEEKQRLFDKEIEEKIKILEQIENKNGEKIYSDLKDSSAYEIESIYAVYEENQPELIKEIEAKLENNLQYVSEELKNDEEIEEKPLTEGQKELIENVKRVEENIGKKLKVVDFEENMKKFPKSYSEYVDKGGLKPDWLGKRVVKAIKNKYAEWKNRKAEVSEEQLLAKEPSAVVKEPIEMPEVEVPEEQLLKEETPNEVVIPVVFDEEKIDENVGVIENAIVPEEQLLGIENDPTLKALEAMPVAPIYEDSPYPDLTETQEMNYAEVRRPIPGNGKSL